MYFRSSLFLLMFYKFQKHYTGCTVRKASATLCHKMASYYKSKNAFKGVGLNGKGCRRAVRENDPRRK